uniref:Uncharacterized protein n=1 Tax=Opuntia streptacantha TaxID=393608 RepID=A0A7C9ERU4_OPUST
MIGGTLAFSPASSSFLLDTTDSNANNSIPSSSSLRKSLNFNPGISCSASSSRTHGHGIPKLEPFSRTKLERAIKEPPLIEKSQRQLAGKLRYYYRNFSYFIEFVSDFIAELLCVLCFLKKIA